MCAILKIIWCFIVCVHKVLIIVLLLAIVNVCKVVYTHKSNYFFVMKIKIKKRLRKHGFLARSKTPGGCRILARRRLKGRSKLTV